ncbi:MAG: YIP1 family protein [Bacilli bacterium]|nr:YIP1 family protein [Bacilli bacterium]MDD4388636.1 YIP1 family protein [Bacilli bacterium]
MRKISIVILMLFTIFILSSVRVATAGSADYGVPYETYTLGAAGTLIPTQTAYLPVGQFGLDGDLSSPQDIFYYRDMLYIADSKNKRIVNINLSGEILCDYKFEEFVLPTGVYRRADYLYVADKGAAAVFKVDLTSGKITERITKPASPLFGQNNKFLPIKVAVDGAGNIYIVGEGSTSGIIHVNYSGEFVGYIGINPVRFSLRKALYNLFVKSSDLASSRPPSPNNLALGSKGSVLTTNDNVRETFKRLNLQGINTLGPATFYPTAQLVDIWLSEENYIYLVSASGQVYEYDEAGNLLFTFNTNDYAKTQSLGLTTNPSGICVDAAGNLYVLDKNYNMIQVYQRTVFVSMVHNALAAYNNGQYLQSKPLWEEIIKHNSSFALAHSALGESLLKEDNYRGALDEFYIAKDYNGYSNAYWQIRNDYIQNYLIIWVAVIAALYLVYQTGKIFLKKREFAFSLGGIAKRTDENKVLKELKQSFLIIRKPGEIFYRIKRHRFGYRSAIIIFILFATVYLVDLYATGFLFRAADPGNVLYRLSILTVLFFLYIVMNYLLSTFSDGEGKFRTVFVASCYALVPYIILTLPMTWLSHYLTYNESFIYHFYHQIVIGWTVFLLILSMKKIHNYTFAETVKNIILILFGMAVVIVVGLMVYSFIGQLIDFIVSVIKEVAYRG